ncbi:MAG TPA: hypothetical protein VGB52_11225 [Actinomycetota bacterium]
MAKKAVLTPQEVEVEDVRRALNKVAEAPAAYRARTRAGATGKRAADPRLEAYRGAREVIRRFANAPEWRDHPLVLDLLDRTFELEVAIEQDPSGRDPDWKLREIRDQIVDIVAALQRQAGQREMDDASGAVAFLLEHLRTLRQADLGALVGVDPRTVRGWKARRPSAVRKQPERVVLVARLVDELRRSRTPLGIMQWFTRARPQLEGRTPLELLEQDVARATDALIPLARASRGQMAS